MDSNIEASAAESESETGGSRKPEIPLDDSFDKDRPPSFDMDGLAFSESESNTSSGNSTGSEGERSLWVEVFAGINISDISDISDQDSELDGLKEVGQMKKGLVDEENDSDSDCDSTGSCDSDNSDRYADDTDFNYMLKADPWTDEELLSFLLYDIRHTEDVSRRAYERFGKVIRQFSMTSSYATQATLHHLEDVTSMRHRRYDCCINSCLAYTEDIEATKCTHCNKDRYHPGGKTPRATFDYIPLIVHRLRLHFSSARRAKILTEYPAACTKEYFEKMS